MTSLDVFLLAAAGFLIVLAICALRLAGIG